MEKTEKQDEKLTRYRNKRDFGRSAEPTGKESGTTAKKGLIYAVQHHDASRLHYDLRLEWKGVLLSWAVPKGPSYLPSDKRLAVRVEDHPIGYADFEGAIPKGSYGGGTVMLWDIGEWQPITDVEEGIKDGSLKFDLYGQRLKGRWALVKMKSEDDADNWLLVKDKDEYAQPSEGISRFDTSVSSGRTMEEIAADEAAALMKNPFDSVAPQLAKLSDKIPEGDDWIYEIKYDGYRIIAFAENGSVRLVSRNGADYTDKFAPAAQAIAELSKDRSMVLDGEMIVADEKGVSDFSALQTYVNGTQGKELSYMVFDLLALDGRDFRDVELTFRKERLEALMENAPLPLRYGKHVAGKGKEFFNAAAEMGLEGIVGKRADSTYGGDRNGSWIKIKCYRRQEFVIGGYTLSERKEGGIAAVLLGYYDGNKLVYIGRAGTGIDARTAAQLKEKFAGIERGSSPFSNEPDRGKNETLVFVEPKLVAEIQYAEVTREDRLRQASFKGLREDKSPEEVTLERAEKDDTASSDATAAAPTAEKESKKAAGKRSETVLGVKISSPDKIVFDDPLMKKIDVIRYYEKVSDRMLPFIEDRLLSVVRCHRGVKADCYYKKHPDSDNGYVDVTSVTNADGNKSDYFSVDEKSGLIAEAQSGTIEFHFWGSRTDTLEEPDIMVFDLDPDETMSVDGIRQGVRDLKSVLDGLGLKSFLKTSGGKGYHVVVPFEPRTDWDTFHDFARRVAEVMEAQWPDRYTSNIRKNKRGGKIFIDWIRNGRGATSVAPYSLRARKGAKVSMPIAWEELDSVTPDGIDYREALARLKKSDPWQDIWKTPNKMSK